MSDFRTDPRWLAARAELLDDPRPGEDGDAEFMRRCAAAYDMYVIEVTAEGGVPKSMQELMRHCAVTSAAANLALRGAA